MDKALLLGNGLNRVGADYSWEDLIHGVLELIDPPNTIEGDGKPFPLLYEEMVQAALEVGMAESEIKQHIAKLIAQIQGNDLHQKLRELPVNEILTTNYDYNIEAIWQDADPIEKDTTESKYSLFRNKRFPDTCVWHIHGERDFPASILLGYEHYAGYLQYMRDYATKGREPRKAPSLQSRLKVGIGPEAHSWVDLLFNRNVYILGLTMDYVEMHLWWLLTWRARMKSISKYKIENKITYIYPRFVGQETKSQRANQDIRHRLQLLKVAGIHLRRIDVRKKEDRWRAFYANALRFVGRDS